MPPRSFVRTQYQGPYDVVGGVRGGLSCGAIDDYEFRAVEDPTHVHDLPATLLALLGLDHEKLTCRYAERDFRLTDVHGVVAKGIFA